MDDKLLLMSVITDDECDEDFYRYLEKVEDVNYTVLNGYSPLMQACCCDNPLAVEILLEKGANPNFSSHKEWTPLTLALDNNNILNHRDEIVKLLLGRGANPYTRLKDGKNVLDYCDSFFEKLGIETYYREFNPVNIKPATGGKNEISR